MPFESVNPATGSLLERYEEHDHDEVNKRIDRADAEFRLWRQTSFSHRSRLMNRAADELRTRREEYARMMTMEMGKPIAQSRAEVDKCGWVCEWYAENAERILAKEVLASDASESFVRFDPIGVVLAIMPWNFPFWQVFRFAAPALMAGNTGLLKHAPNVPGCALMIEEVFRRAGFPEGCFQTLMITPASVEAVIDNPLVVAATLTGSESAGSHVASQSGRRLKKTVMELGGSDPFIVLDDADIESAAAVGAASRMLNTGQSCIAAKRFIVTEAVAERFTTLFVQAVDKMKLGDPLLEETDIGAIAREDLLLNLDAQVRASLELGATLLTGGRRADRAGVFYQQTVLGNVHKGMPVFDEETFGPVAAIITVADEEEAVSAANDSVFGLGASLWTRDLERAHRLAPRIESGSVFVNGLVKSDPRLPFGGIKHSGYGRELSHYGIREFVNIKTVWVA